MRLLAALLFAAPTLAQGAPPTSPILKDWQALLADKCDLAKHHVVTPLGARVLRNAPYAQQGYVFKSAELRALYSADGGWYVPKPEAKPVFDAAVGQCIKALKAHEAALRKRLKWKKDAMERRITGMHALVRELRNNMRGTKKLLRRDIFGATDDRTWHLIDGCGVDDAGEKLCNGPQLVCTPEKCFMAFPG